jgi:hypothetical protein
MRESITDRHRAYCRYFGLSMSDTGNYLAIPEINFRLIRLPCRPQAGNSGGLRLFSWSRIGLPGAADLLEAGCAANQDQGNWHRGRAFLLPKDVVADLTLWRALLPQSVRYFGRSHADHTEVRNRCSSSRQWPTPFMQCRGMIVQ